MNLSSSLAMAKDPVIRLDVMKKTVLQAVRNNNQYDHPVKQAIDMQAKRYQMLFKR